MKAFSAMWSAALGQALKEATTEPYTMSLVGDDAGAVQGAVNQGIDSYLASGCRSRRRRRSI